MDYKIEFERLLQFAKQALSGVVIDKREVIGFLGLSILDDVVRDYESRLSQHITDDCSYSPNKKHVFGCEMIEVCLYCDARKEERK